MKIDPMGLQEGPASVMDRRFLGTNYPDSVYHTDPETAEDAFLMGLEIAGEFIKPLGIIMNAGASLMTSAME